MAGTKQLGMVSPELTPLSETKKMTYCACISPFLATKRTLPSGNQINVYCLRAVPVKGPSAALVPRLPVEERPGTV